MKKTVSGFLFVALMIMCHHGLAQVVVETQSNTHCAIPNGGASASVGGEVTGYTFEWYDAAMNSLGITGPLAQNLAAGIYSVIARDASTEALVGQVAFAILDEIVLPVVSLESITNTSCGPAGNGALMTTVAGGLADYGFAWFEGADPQGTLISTNANLTGRSAGIYTLQVTSLVTGCVTTVSAQINDAPAIPVVTVVVTNNTNCAAPNGSLTAVTEQNASQYTITWYDAAMNPLGVTGPVASNLAGGNYTVTVTGIATGCTATVAAAVTDQCDQGSPGFSDFAGNVITNQKKEPGSSVSYYPNPASGTLWVTVTEPAALTLVNQNGETVLSQNVNLVNTAIPLDVSGLRPGRYILRVNAGGVIKNYQVVIKR